VNPRNADMVVEDAGLELVFNGEKFFSTGKTTIYPDDGLYLIMALIIP